MIKFNNIINKGQINEMTMPFKKGKGMSYAILKVEHRLTAEDLAQYIAIQIDSHGYSPQNIIAKGKNQLIQDLTSSLGNVGSSIFEDALEISIDDNDANNIIQVMNALFPEVAKEISVDSIQNW